MHNRNPKISTFCTIVRFFWSVFWTSLCIFNKNQDFLYLIKIPPYNGGYFSFGHSPNTTGYAQVRILLACQPRNCYLLPVNGFAISLPAEGGGTTQGVTEGVAEIARHALVLKRVLNCKFRVLLHRFAEPPRGGSLWHKKHSAFNFCLSSAHRQSLH